MSHIMVHTLKKYTFMGKFNKILRKNNAKDDKNNGLLQVKVCKSHDIHIVTIVY